MADDPTQGVQFTRKSGHRIAESVLKSELTADQLRPTRRHERLSQWRYRGPFACTSKLDSNHNPLLVRVGNGWAYNHLKQTNRDLIDIQGAANTSGIDLTSIITSNGEGSYYPYVRFYVDPTDGSALGPDWGVTYNVPIRPPNANGCYFTLCEAVVRDRGGTNVIVDVIQWQYGPVYCIIWRWTAGTFATIYKSSFAGYNYVTI